MIRIAAGLAVAVIVGVTAMLTYHVTVSPLGGIFERLVPKAGGVLAKGTEEGFAAALDAAEMPDFDPGDRVFQKAHEFIALNEVEKGREKLMEIVTVFPFSPVAPKARRILGDMNLDEILSSDFTEGKSKYTVRSGDSYFAIAGRNDTTLDMIMHLNRMFELEGLQPGDELLLMPLNYRVLIEPERNSVSLWDGERFVTEYPIMNLKGTIPSNRKTEIASRSSTIEGRSVSPTQEKYRFASRSIVLKAPPIQIFPFVEGQKEPMAGIYLRSVDLEELYLLTRNGNVVEIRTAKK